MSKARLVITAIDRGPPASEVVADYGVSRSWVYELLARYRAEGDAAFEPRRGGRGHRARSDATVELIVSSARHSRRPAWTPARTPSPGTCPPPPRSRCRRPRSAGPDPRPGRPGTKKRPKSSYIRFEAEQPNETWQADFTHYRLTDGPDTEILTFLDDHSRYALHVTAHRGSPARPSATRSAKRVTCWFPGIHAHRQRHGLHHPPVRRPRATQRIRAELALGSAEELPTQPPHHLREGRSFHQTMKKWLYAPKSPQARQHPPHCRPSSRGIPRRGTTTADRTGPCPAEQPRPPPTRPAPKPPRRRPGRRDPRPGPSPTRLDNSGMRDPAGQRPHAPHRCRTNPTPEPTSSGSSSTTSASASSTPPPANSSASSPSTPARRTTKAPDDHQDPHRRRPETTKPDPNRGSG